MNSRCATVTTALLGFLVCSCEDEQVRWFKSGAVFLGFMSHLVLDEYYSFEVKRGRLRVKRSFGTALKMWSTRSLWANISTYGKLVIVGLLAVGDPIMMEKLESHSAEVHHTARDWVKELVEGGEKLLR